MLFSNKIEIKDLADKKTRKLYKYHKKSFCTIAGIIILVGSFMRRIYIYNNVQPWKKIIWIACCYAQANTDCIYSPILALCRLNASFSILYNIVVIGWTVIMQNVKKIFSVRINASRFACFFRKKQYIIVWRLQNCSFLLSIKVIEENFRNAL